MKKILVVAGRSGSGKTSALQVLEDLGYYIIDNLPLALIPEIVAKLNQDNLMELLALVLISVVLRGSKTLSMRCWLPCRNTRL